MVALASLYI